VTDLPAGYAYRAPVAHDVGLRRDARCRPAAAGFQPTLDAAFVRDLWSLPVFDIATDAWVVTDAAGTVVAYGQVMREERDIVGSWGVVHLEHRGRGIGMALLRRSFGVLVERGLRRVLVNVDAENVTGATGLYERAGTRIVNRWDRWERRLDGSGR
jgi:ribosomal protein S18 acetylase RimI-like enzyme